MNLKSYRKVTRALSFNNHVFRKRLSLRVVSVIPQGLQRENRLLESSGSRANLRPNLEAGDSHAE